MNGRDEHEPDYEDEWRFRESRKMIYYDPDYEPQADCDGGLLCALLLLLLGALLGLLVGWGIWA